MRFFIFLGGIIAMSSWLLAQAQAPASAPASADAPPAVKEFLSACDAAYQKALKADSRVIAGNDGWLFWPPELRHLSVGPYWGQAAAGASKAKPAQADPLPAILDFKKQLDARGIELILLPVPAKATLYPELLSPAVPAKPPAEAIDAYDQQFMAILRKNGVNVIDLAAPLRQAKAKGQQVYCRQDTHWSPLACRIAAECIADEIKARPWLGGIAKQKFQSEPQQAEIAGDLWEAMPQPRPARERLEFHVVRPASEAGAEGEALLQQDASAIVLLGDSHCLVFHSGDDMLYRGAGLADHLALALGLGVDVCAVKGSGATAARVDFARNARQTPGYLAGKKLVIWCFSVSEFTEGDGWRTVKLSN